MKIRKYKLVDEFFSDDSNGVFIEAYKKSSIPEYVINDILTGTPVRSNKRQKTDIFIGYRMNDNNILKIKIKTGWDGKDYLGGYMKIYKLV